MVKLLQEMRELETYIGLECRKNVEPGSYSEMTFAEGVEEVRKMFYRAGLEPPKVTKPKGPPIDTRHLYVTAYEMQLSGMTIRKIAKAKCTVADCEHGEACQERFRKGIANVRAMLTKMNPKWTPKMNQPRQRN